MKAPSYMFRLEHKEDLTNVWSNCINNLCGGYDSNNLVVYSQIENGRRVSDRQSQSESECNGFKCCGNVDMGACSVYLNRKGIHKWFTGTILVFGAECAMSYFIYTLCKAYQE